MIELFSSEKILLDFLKLLDYNQLHFVHQINARFYKFVSRFSKELALKEFYKIKLVLDGSVPFCENSSDLSEEYSLQFGSYKFSFDDQQKKKWEGALTKFRRIPTFCSAELANDSYQFLWIMTECDEFRVLRLRFPLYLESVEDFCFAHFWLERLSECAFRFGKFYKALLNAKMLKLLFGESEKCESCSPHFVLHFGSVFLKLPSYKKSNPIDGTFLEFAQSHLQLTERLTLFLDREACSDEILDFLFKSGGQIPEVVFIRYHLFQFFDLHNRLIRRAATSKDCSGLVPSIKFLDIRKLPLPDFGANFKKYEGWGERDYVHGWRPDDFHFTKFEISADSKSSESPRFAVLVWHPQGSREFTRLQFVVIKVK